MLKAAWDSTENRTVFLSNPYRVYIVLQITPYPYNYCLFSLSCQSKDISVPLYDQQANTGSRAKQWSKGDLDY